MSNEITSSNETTIESWLDFHDEIVEKEVKEVKVHIPNGCKLKLSYHINFVPKRHSGCSTEKISLLQLWPKNGKTAHCVMDGFRFFLTQRQRHPLHMGAVDFVLNNIVELIQKSQLSEEINLILFAASVFPSHFGPVIISISKAPDGPWKVDESGYGVEESFVSETTAFAIYTME